MFDDPQAERIADRVERPPAGRVICLCDNGAFGPSGSSFAFANHTEISQLTKTLVSMTGRGRAAIIAGFF